MHNPTVNLIDADQQTITSEPINSSLKSWLASFEYSKSTYLSYKAVVNKILAFLQEKQLKIDALSDDDGKALLEWVRDYYQLSNSNSVALRWRLNTSMLADCPAKLSKCCDCRNFGRVKT